MKYKVTEGPNHGGLGQHIKDRFSVRDETQTLAFMLTEAQARIFEWALNTVANKRILCSLEPRNARKMPGEIWYDGPTDGVAL